MSTNYINIIKSAIDVPLMDVNNISKLILGYIEKKLYKLHYYTSRDKHDYFDFYALILASSPEECWEEWLILRETVENESYRESVKWRLSRNNFLNHLTLCSYKPYYSGTKIQYAHIDEFEEGCILEYKRPTKKVFRKDIIENDNAWSEGRMIKHRFEDVYNCRIRDKDGIDEHDFSMFPFDNVDLMFDEKKKSLYYRDFIEGEYTVGCVTFPGRHLDAVFI
jgi:hypothetical protein